MPETLAPPAGTTEWACHDCQRKLTTKGARLPKSWKRLEGDSICNLCWRKRYILRAVTLPIATVVDIPWTEFTGMVRELWAQTTQASNWMLTELYIRDRKRTEAEPKLALMPPAYLYPEVRPRFPALPPQTVASLEQAVKQKYMKRRYEVIWTCSASLPTYRYPTPVPIHNQSWSVFEDGKDQVVSVRFADQRVNFKLRTGARYFRQRSSVAAMINGTAIRGELALYRHGRELMCKIAGWFPRTGSVADRDGTLTVRTSAEGLLTAVNMKDEKLWQYHGDQVRRWIAEHEKVLQRWADDSKAEHRPIPPFAARRRAAVSKHRERMATAIHTMAAMAVNYAVRRKFATLLYDDTYREFAAKFPWFELAAKLKEKCDAAGLEFAQPVKVAAQEELLEPSTE